MNISDTAAVCYKSPYPHFTFYDTTSAIFNLGKYEENIPVHIVEANRQYGISVPDTLTGHLKEGLALPPPSPADSWTLFFVLFSSLAYLLLKLYFGNFFSGISDFFSFRKNKKNADTFDLSAVLHWKSAILNFLSLLNMAFFLYCSADVFNLIPKNISGFSFLLICFFFLMAIITIRLLTCKATGSISDNKTVFNEYMLHVIETYRIIAVTSLILSILILYADVIPDRMIVYFGIFAALFVLLCRYLKLCLSFLNFKLSIFYLILYLCTLEIIPLFIVIKLLMLQFGSQVF